jgi:hypothetical protein
MVRDAGDRFSEALNIRLSRDGTATLRNSLSREDQLDFYRVRLNRRSNLTVRLDQLEDDANLAIFNSDQDRIDRSREDDEDAEFLQRLLEPGIYFIRTNRIDGNIPNYRLRVSVSPDAGNGFDAPTPIRVSDNRRSRFSFRDFVGTFEQQDDDDDDEDEDREIVGDIEQDRFDFYRFELSRPTTFRSSLEGLEDNANLALFRNRQRIAFSNAPGRRSESIERRLDSGVYFIRVDIQEGFTSYLLKTSFIPR